MGVTFCAVAPSTRWPPTPPPATPSWPPSSRSARRAARPRPSWPEGKGRPPTGLFVTHPLTGAQVEVWVGNYVLMSYGDGAVMGVPAHDERDFAFAKKYGLPSSRSSRWTARPSPPTPGRSGTATSRRRLRQLRRARRPGPQGGRGQGGRTLGAKGLGEKKTTWRLRDWGISRQRYWGTPIPIIHCDDCGAVPVPEKDLPVVLPEDLIPDGSGNPLNKCASFLNVPCPAAASRPARDRHDGHLRRFVLVLHALLRPDQPDAMVADGASTGCRWTSTSAASSTPSCTCCTRASGPR
jgi:leucyl-tRNA synthetase